MSWVSKVVRRAEGSETKTPLSYPNIFKFLNNCKGTARVDIIDKNTAAYRLDHKSQYKRCYASIKDVTLVNSHFAYTKLPNDI